MDFPPERFEAWSAQHAITAGACVVVIVALAWSGRRFQRTNPDRERRLRFGWVGFVVLFQAYNQLRWFLPAHFDPRGSLPLHVCDVTVVLAPFALLLGNRVLRSLLYFWGIGLSVAALLFPILEEGPARIEFWLYWVGHTQIVASAAYLPAALGYRPAWRDVGTAIVAITIYNFVITPVNVAFDLDYGYTGPHSQAVRDLGPWPQRLVILWLLESAVLVVLWAPWAALRRRLPRNPRNE